jgi:two-component system sensor histidine kinase CssS
MDDKSRVQISDIGKRQDSPQGPPPSQGLDEDDTRMWMAGFIKKDIKDDTELSGVYKGRKFFFIISSFNYGSSGKTYLVSYIPDTEDNSLLYLVIVIGIVFIGIGFITAKIVANYISKPLKVLEEHTKRIAHKDWKEPIIVKSEDEIGRLAGSMNQMQRELKHADEEEKMFLQSISHDLKTPVMVIMSHAAAIIDGVYVESPEKTAEIIRDEAVNLEKKIKQLLYLNTLDYVLENNNENAQIDLREMLLNIINRFEAIDSSIEWELDLDTVMVRGNAEKLQISIDNILDNGIRYAEKMIRIALKKEDNHAVLEIYNDGPNIDKEHMSHIFDHFYKDKTGNFGLGLAISKKIIDFYGGEIGAVNREKGVSFIIRYPLYMGGH